MTQLSARVKLGTSAKNPTLATEIMITFNKWDEDMATKYISVSLLTLVRRVDTFTPWHVDLMNRICAITNTKTIMSEGLVVQFGERGD